MGKASFLTIQDSSGQMQCYLTKNELSEEVYEAFNKYWEMGDIVGIRGVLMRTNKGELTVQAKEIVLLNKTQLPLPEKFHGVTDQEIRYRQRYLDLIVNEDSRSVFRTRSLVMQKNSRVLHQARLLRSRNAHDATVFPVVRQRAHLLPIIMR